MTPRGGMLAWPFGSLNTGQRVSGVVPSVKDILTLDDLSLKGKTVLLRLDINSPINPTDGSFLDISRFEESVPTLNELAESKVVVLAHQSRPGKSDFLTLREHAHVLRRLVSRPVRYVDDLIGSVAQRSIQSLQDGEILLLENTRLYAEEVSLDDKPFDVQGRTHLVRNLSNVADAYVTDAFSAAHRSQPTLVGFCERLPCAAGRLFEREVDGVGRALGEGERPVCIILGGAKADDSIMVAQNALASGGVDWIITGGVVANIFLAAKGVDIGEVNMKVIAKEVKDPKAQIAKAAALLKAHPARVKVPVDVSQKGPEGLRRARAEAIDPALPILDIGVDTVVDYISTIRASRTVIANGPMGVFEEEPFAFGTREVYNEIGKVKGYTLLGGGHTSVVANALGIDKKVSHMSTGGGALITFLGGGEMPVIDALRRSKELYEAGQFALKPRTPS